MKRDAKYPMYDRVRDGNVFHWLLNAAEVLRAQRIEVKRREFLGLNTTEPSDKKDRKKR